MRVFHKVQDGQIKDIITNVFRPGDYMITVYYGKKAGVFFHDKHLLEVINRLKKGYQEKEKGFIFVGAANTEAVRLIVNADIEAIEIVELLWNSMDCLQMNLLVTTTQQGIQQAAEEMLANVRYIVVSELAGKIDRLWRESSSKELRRKSRFILKVHTPRLIRQNEAHN